MATSIIGVTDMAKGYVFLTTPEGGEVKADCVFDHFLVTEGKFRDIVHQSSVAYSSDRVSIPEEHVSDDQTY